LSGFYWTFDVANDTAFQRLAEAVQALREAKLSGNWRDGNYWKQVFRGANVAWGVEFLVERFKEGEFVLIGLRRDDFGTAELQDLGTEPMVCGYLDFEPFACPYSGDCMGQIIEAFGHSDVSSFGA
jgi:hypothetical protein